MDHYLRAFLEPRSIFPSGLHSDTVAGALIQASALLHGAEEADALVKEEGFRASSGFPFVMDGDERHVFYPKPLLEPDTSIDDPEKAKEYRKAAFVHEKVFWNIVEKRLREQNIIGGIGRDYKIKDRLIYPRTLELDFEIAHHSIPHNTLNRLTSQSIEFFYQEGAWYRNCGIYFLLATDLPETLRKLRGAIEFLSDRGFGGSVSTGGGKFKVEFDEEFDGSREGNAKVLLSLYNPSPEDLEAIDIKNSYYSVEPRRGVTATGRLRRSVMMFAPGSVLRTTGADLRGRVLRVSEDPPNVEWGLYLGVGMGG
jgi:CRISPR-associated protein Csm4